MGTKSFQFYGLYNGWRVQYHETRDTGEEEIDLEETVAYLRELGVAPTGGEKPSAPAPVAAPAAAGTWKCPTHGGTKIRPGYQGRGLECAVTSRTAPDWPYREWQGKSGDTFFSCTQKSH